MTKKILSYFFRVSLDQQRFGISAPSLPRKSHAPQRLQVGSTEGDIHSNVNEYYRVLYFEAIDLVIEAITERFDQPGYGIYSNLENLILKACKGHDYTMELCIACEFYGDDLDKLQLSTQLLLLVALINDAQKSDEKELIIHNIVEILCKLISAQKCAFTQVFIVMKLLLVMPATNACSERSFSALRRLKTHTMSQQRLNDLMILYIHKSETDSIDLSEIGNEFVTVKE